MPVAADPDILDSPEAGHAAVRGAGLRIVGYVIGVVLSVGSAAVLLRYLGVADFGRYTTVFSLMTIVAGATEAGTTAIGIRELAVQGRDRHQHVLSSLQGMRTALTAAGVALAVAFAVAAGYTDAMVLGAVLAGVGLVITTFGQLYWIPLQAELRLGAVTVLELVRQAVTVVGLIAVAAAGGGIALLLGVPVLVGIAVIGSGAILVRGAWNLRPLYDRVEWRRLMSDSIPYAAATAIGIIYSYVTVLIMSLVATEEEVGLFGAAFRIFIVLTQIPNVLVTSAFPVLARAGRDDLVRLRAGVQRMFDSFAVVAVGLALLAVIGAPVAIDVVAGPEYEESIGVLRIQAAAMAGTFMLALGAYTLLALRMHTALIVANVTGLVVSSGLTFALAPGMGAEGAAIANLAGECVVAAIYFFWLWRSADILPSPRVLPRLALAAGVAVAGGVLLGLPALPATLLAGILFTAMAFVLKLVPEEALAILRARRGAGADARTPPPSAPS